MTLRSIPAFVLYFQSMGNQKMNPIIDSTAENGIISGVILINFMKRTLIGLILVITIFAGLGFLGWYFVKEKIRSQQEYILSANNIVVTPTPDWVPDQFVEDVLRSSGQSRTSLLDKTLPQKLTEAFSAYPWVERVEQVVPRYPSGAEVKIIYRVPVALVEIPQRGTVPVDRYGVVLPSEYISESTVDRRDQHLIVQDIQSMPLGSVGTPWGDPMVLAAAQLAAALADIAEPLNLTRIIPTTETLSNKTGIACRLQTAGGTEIRWGTFDPDSQKIEAKKAKLRDLYVRYESLDKVPAGARDLSRE
jgi:hypothetical protein